MPTDKHFDILAIGEPMIEFNETEPALYRQGFGGDTSNFAVAAARQGARTAYYTRLGDDRFGAMLRALWQAEGIDTSAVQTDPDAHTAVYFVTHGEHGHEFHYLRAGSAASRMQSATLPADLIRGSHILHVSGISQAVSASACDAVFSAINIAHEAGTRITYDPNLRLRLWPMERARAVIEATIPHADVFLPSLDEALALADTDSLEAAFDWCARCGARQVVLKCGADGAWVWRRDSRTAKHVPPFRVRPVDATGAGDCFDGTLAARLVAGDELEDAVRYANVAAALSTTGYGAVAPIPDHATVLVNLARSLLGA
ncbi:MAG TPA: sugar kinase [Noviherbaspirillum sp.]